MLKFKNMIKTLKQKLGNFISSHYARLSSPKKSFASNTYQAIFLIFLVIGGFFVKDNPYLVFPEVLWFFLFLLVFNGFTNYIFARWSIRFWIIDLLVVVNCFLITGSVHFSGGYHSQLWVLYLLPILTSAMMLERRQLAWTTFLAIFFNAWFYGNPFSDWDYDIALELGGKSTIMFLGALMMRSLAHDKEKVEDELEKERKKLDDMSKKMTQKSFQHAQASPQVDAKAALASAHGEGTQITPENIDGLAQVGHIAAGIVHDLGTPVTIILGSARLISLDEKVQDKADVQRIIDAALLCKNIIANTLSIAKGEKYTMEALDLRDPIESALKIASPLLQEKKVVPHFNNKEKLPDINGSFIHLERLFMNLFFNSRGAMPDGGDIYISVKTINNGKTVEAVVEDTGPGFSETLIKEGPKNFSTTKRPGEGTGLGLVVSKGIVEKHGGTMEFANRLKGGAKIIMHLPVIEQTADTAIQPNK